MEMAKMAITTERQFHRVTGKSLPSLALSLHSSFRTVLKLNIFEIIAISDDTTMIAISDDTNTHQPKYSFVMPTLIISSIMLISKQSQK